MLPTKFRFIWPSDFRGDDLKKNRPIRNKNIKIVLIIVNINKDENKSLISNQFSLKNDL